MRACLLFVAWLAVSGCGTIRPVLYPNVYTQAVLGQGASREETLQAVSVAVLMQRGPGMAGVVEFMKALEAFGGQG